MNPYLVPGLENEPFAPLCPFEHEDHEKFYVPVDNTHEAFQTFQAKIALARGFTTTGRLVAVAGNTGCGKTSLINRCAAWLKEQLGDNAQIFRLTDACLPTESIKLRMVQVLSDLVDELGRPKRGVHRAHIEELRKKLDDVSPHETAADETHLADLRRVYKYLDDALPPETVAIILLPRSDSGLEKEIANYASLARCHRIVFFAENDHSEAVRRSLSVSHSGDNGSLIVLEVGPLQDEDGWRFVEARLTDGSVPDDTPGLSSSTLDRVIKGPNVSIRWLHRLLYGVYQEFFDQPELVDSLPLREVSYEYLATYSFRTARRMEDRA